MIAFIAPLPVGNAIRVLLSPLKGTEKTRVLRKATDDIGAHDDATAALVYEGSEAYFVDTAALINGTTYFYKAFDFDGVAWSTSESVHATPAAASGLIGPDVLSVVRDRLLLGLKAAVVAGKLSNETGHIPVFTAPPQFEGLKWPLVTVHLQSDAPEMRALGEEVQSDAFDSEFGEWSESEGWLSRVQIQIVSWCQNADQRIDLRKAIKAVIIGNLPVFDSLGIVQVDMSQSDVEDFESYGTPVYQTISNFSCLAPSVVQSTEGSIRDVTVVGEAA